MSAQSIQRYWLNIDIPTKKCTLHSETCTYVNKLTETEFKGINKVKRDGCWKSFDSEKEAKEYHHKSYSKYELSRHC